jgi:hypothetical protein
LKQYHLIGWFLARTDPQKAASIIDTYIKPAPRCNDFEQIPAFLQHFSQLKDIQPIQIKGALMKRQLVDTRKLFISVMIRIYNPQVYNHPKDGMVFTYGFSIYLAELLQLKQSHISRTIRECIMEERVYEQTRRAVDEIEKQLMDRYDNDNHCE